MLAVKPNHVVRMNSMLWIKIGVIVQTFTPIHNFKSRAPRQVWCRFQQFHNVEVVSFRMSQYRFVQRTSGVECDL